MISVKKNNMEHQTSYQTRVFLFITLLIQCGSSQHRLCSSPHMNTNKCGIHE